MNRSTIRYLVVQIVHGVLHNPWNHVITTMTIALASLVFAVFLFLFHNVGQIMERWQTSAEVTVYLQKGFDEGKQKALFETVKNFEGVLEPQWISEEQALVRFKTELGSQQSLLDGLKT